MSIFGNFIDGQLSSVYQLLESRIIPESDDDLIRIACNFAKNSDRPMENVLRALADYSSFFSDISVHSSEILELLNQVLLKSSSVFSTALQTNEEDAIVVKQYAAEIYRLGEVFLLDAAKTLSDGQGIDQSLINSGCLACQFIIQVVVSHQVLFSNLPKPRLHK